MEVRRGDGRRGRPRGLAEGGIRRNWRLGLGVLLTSGLLTAGLAGSASAASKPRAAGPSTLAAGGVLASGKALASPSGQFTLTMSTAGALVETSGTTQLWSSGTAVTDSSARLEPDGQLEVLSPEGAPVWATPAPATPMPAGTSPELTVEDTGPLTIAASTSTLWVSGPTDTTLVPGQGLQPGWSLTTPNGQYTLTMQPSGALTLRSGGAQLWSTGGTVVGSVASMQSDGNLAVYSPAQQLLWSSGTGGHPGLVLALDGAGQVVLQNPLGIHLWGEPASHWGLVPGQELLPGWYVKSANGLFELTMSPSGRLVEYLAQPAAALAVWYTKAAPVAGSTVAMQSSGNLVMTSPTGKVVWSSGTTGKPGTGLVLTNDDDVLLSDAGTTLWNSNSVSLGSVIVADAADQLGNADTPAGTFCNPYTAYWGVGAACGNANRSEAWCADFAAWVWQRAGVAFAYGWQNVDINAASASFYQWGAAHGTWHWAWSGYRPRPGDVAVFGLNRSGTYADHAAVVLEPGTAGADVINGDWWSTGNGSVALQDDETTATGSDVLSGYASPVPGATIDAHLAPRLGPAEALAHPAAPASAVPAGEQGLLSRQASAARSSELLGNENAAVPAQPLMTSRRRGRSGRPTAGRRA
ncbi:MAG: CHAP domain-containing protein [Acidimicrobiales bacterium]